MERYGAIESVLRAEIVELEQALADAQATVEALQRERDEARHTADVYQKLYGTAVMDRAIVHNEKADLQAALDAERASGGCGR